MGQYCPKMDSNYLTKDLKCSKFIIVAQTGLKSQQNMNWMNLRQNNYWEGSKLMKMDQKWTKIDKIWIEIDKFWNQPCPNIGPLLTKIKTLCIELKIWSKFAKCVSKRAQNDWKMASNWVKQYLKGFKTDKIFVKVDNARFCYLFSTVCPIKGK